MSGMLSVGCGEVLSGSTWLPCTNSRMGLMLEAVETVSLRSRSWLRPEVPVGVRGVGHVVVARAPSLVLRSFPPESLHLLMIEPLRVYSPSPLAQFQSLNPPIPTIPATGVRPQPATLQMRNFSFFSQERIFRGFPWPAKVTRCDRRVQYYFLFLNILSAA